MRLKQQSWISSRIPKSTYEATDIVHWLALTVASRTLEDAGYTKESIPKQQTSVIVGNTLTGEYTRSTSMRLRWPYVRRTLRKTAQNLNLSSHLIESLETQMEECYKSTFPEITEDTLVGGLSNTIAGRICNYFESLLQGGYEKG